MTDGLARATLVIVYAVGVVWVGSFMVLVFGDAHSNKAIAAVNGTMVVLLGFLFADTVRKKNGRRTP